MNDETKILQDIESGKYRSHFLVYNRKSTDDLDNQKNSITYQKIENVRFARKELLAIAPITLNGFCADGIISEKHSGFKEDNGMVFGDDGSVQYQVDRPKFYRLVQFLNTGYFKGIVVLCWDRISRNKNDSMIIRKLMKQGIDVRFTYANYDKTSSGELHMDIDGMFAEHHSRTTSEKVTITFRNQREKGICTYRAPVGYLNEGNMNHKPFDPVRAPIIKQMFELCATGEWSLADLARWANEQGFTMPPMRRPRTQQEMLAEETDEINIIEPTTRPIVFTGVQKILTNPFYLGKIIGNNKEYIPSNSHAPLITQELFDQVQIALNKKKISAHYIEKLDHPYRGLVRCEFCNRLYTPYIKKGIQYYSSRCKDGCCNKTKTFNIGFFEERIGQLISNLAFTNDELAEIDARTNTDVVVFEQKRISLIEQNDRKKKKIREDIAYLRSNRLNLLKTGAYSPEDYIAEEGMLNKKLGDLQDAEQTSDVAMHEVIKDVIKLSELLKDTNLYYQNANPQEKEEIIKIIFSELVISGETLSYKCSTGFQPFENRMSIFGDPTGSRTRLSSLRRMRPNR